MLKFINDIPRIDILIHSKHSMNSGMNTCFIGELSYEAKKTHDSLVGLHSLVYANDLFFVVRATCFTYTMRHHKLSTLAALN